MMKKIKKAFSARMFIIFTAFLLFAACPLTAQASADPSGTYISEQYVNEETGYSVRIEDEAGLIPSEDLKRIEGSMDPLTAHGNAGFYTTDYTPGSTERLAKAVYREWFGSDSGVLLVIDMDNRNIWIWSNGSINRVLGKEWADIITDNVYTYASRGDYTGCAVSAFEQLGLRLAGEKVYNPLKTGTSALLSVLISLAVILGVLLAGYKKKQDPDMLLPLAGAAAAFTIANTDKVHVRTTKRYTPKSSGGGGGFSGGGGGGSGGGGGGSGGGHGF